MPALQTPNAASGTDNNSAFDSTAFEGVRLYRGAANKRVDSAWEARSPVFGRDGKRYWESYLRSTQRV